VKRREMILASVLLALAPLWASAADLSGTWKATFEGQMGPMEYTYTFVQKGSVLTGVAKNPMGQSDLKDGKVDNDTVTFVEPVSFGGMDISISYTGKIVSPNEIQFTREVGSFATEKATAKRSAG